MSGKHLEGYVWNYTIYTKLHMVLMPYRKFLYHDGRVPNGYTKTEKDELIKVMKALDEAKI